MLSKTINLSGYLKFEDRQPVLDVLLWKKSATGRCTISSKAGSRRSRMLVYGVFGFRPGLMSGQQLPGWASVGWKEVV